MSKQGKRTRSAAKGKQSGNSVELKNPDDGRNDIVAKAKPLSLKNTLLPRQMIRVQRSEPSDGIVRNELRFVSYAAKSNEPQPPVETHVVSEAFGALVARLRELETIVPEVEDQAAQFGADRASLNAEITALKDRLAASEEECERLRRAGSENRMNDVPCEPDWIRHTENQIKMVMEQLNSVQTAAQKFSPQVTDLKTHLRQILDDIHDRRLKGQLYDERVRDQIHSKVERCHRMAMDTMSKNRF